MVSKLLRIEGDKSGLSLSPSLLLCFLFILLEGSLLHISYCHLADLGLSLP